MKIAMIGQKGIPATWGGIEIHVEEIASRLAERSHSVTVYSRKWYTQDPGRDHKGVHITHTPTIHTKHLDALTHGFTSTLHSLGKKFDIVHYHGIGPGFFCPLTRITGRKTVLTVHSLDWERGKWSPFAKRCLKLAEKIAVAASHQTIVVSKHLVDYIDTTHGTSCVYIPNGVTIPRILEPHRIREQHGLEKEKYILYMGRFVPEKRIEWIIELFRELQNTTGEPLKLVLAGGSSASDTYMEHLKRLAKNERDIIFTGYVTGEVKEELMSNARLFILPSYLEGLPIALLEAMSYGRPCLVSDIAPHQCIIEDGVNGFLFHHDSYSDLVEKARMILVLNRTSSLEMTSHAQKLISENYNWDRIVDRLEEVYHEITG